MANPSPQHNPTDGKGTAVAIVLSDAAAKMTKVGSQVALSPGNRIGGHQYALTMSVAGGANPFVPSTDHITPLVVDILGLTFTTGNGNVVKWRAYESPASGANSGKEIANVTGEPDGGCDILALNPGQCIVEAYFPTFDNSEGTYAEFIYSQIILTVTP